ncbi:MAG: glycerophosphoryl diester phosphodiesterase membrane domain-containing protein [Actinomycetota bacterium]|nr:glycerophosphoryl diester phosphodiesterase membrane domain-containing protein [Actinomycetota bacterium]
MSGFGPPPGAPAEDSRRRPVAYLPPGGLRTRAGMPVSPTAGRGPHSSPLLVTSHKPGIVALRPMSLGDLLDASVKHARRNPGPVLGLSLLVLTASAVPAILLATVGLAAGWYSRSGGQAVLDRTGFFALVLAFGVGFAAAVLGGALSSSVGESVLGRRPGVGELWRAVRSRLLALLGLEALRLLALALPVLVVGLVIAAVSASLGAVLLVGAVGGLLVAAWSALFTTRTCLAASAVVLEGRSIRAALRRSLALTSGAFWRVFGRLLVVGLLAVVVFWVLQLPLLLVGAILASLVDASPSVSAVLSSVGLAVATLLAATVVVPFVAGATCLTYVDQRMRKEGFDVVLQRSVRAGDVALTGGPR